MSRFAVVALLCLTSLSLCWADVPGDLIDTLPGYGKTPSKQYSGFLPVDEAKTVFLHYWFVTSTREPSIDPLTVWMNGGPGCSSLEGFLTELGPFKFTGERDSTGLPLLTDNLVSSHSKLRTSFVLGELLHMFRAHLRLLCAVGLDDCVILAVH